jgi:hypothetical protein
VKPSLGKKSVTLPIKMNRPLIMVISVGIFAFVAFYIFTPSSSPIVQTVSGKVQGTVGKSRIGKEFYEYVGIPYGTPPLGELRFEVKI